MTDHDNESAHGLQASSVKQRIDEQVKPVPPAVCEFAVNELADLRARLAKYEDAEGRPLRNGLRYTNDGELAECPCCGSLDVGGANGTVSCYGCGLQITKPRPLKNAADAWNKRATLSAPSHGEQVREDAKRLDFMLTKCRKVIVERLPHDNFEVYVEEGFLGDKRYPSVRYSGDWETGEPYALAIQREAIDAAMLAAAPSAGSHKSAGACDWPICTDCCALKPDANAPS